MQEPLMKTRITVLGAVVVSIAIAGVSAQTQAQPQAARGAQARTQARPVAKTPWGHPDLQGTWDYRTITPLERPAQYGDREFLTDEEVKVLEERAAKRMDEAPAEDAPASTVHAAYWTDPGRFVAENRRTSLIVDPPNGRIPQTVAAAAAARAGGAGAAAPPAGGGRGRGGRPGGRAD